MEDAPSLRETIESAVSAADSTSAPEAGTTTTTEAPAPVEATSTAPVEATTTTDTRTASERARDEAGRFAKKPTATAKPAPAATTATPAPEAVQPPTTSEPKFKPPQSWRPLAREKWATLPPEVQEDAVRLDREIQRTMQESARARQFHDEFRQAVQPFEGMLAAEGSDPIKAARALFQTAAAFRSAPPDFVADQMVGMIMQYGVGRFGPQFLQALDAKLGGVPGPQIPHQPPPPDPRSIVREEFDRMRTEALQSKAKTELQKFAAEAEFLRDPSTAPRVQAMMRSIILAEAEEGVEVSYPDAYDRACQAIPDVAKALRQREAAKAAATAQAATQRARVAGSSIKADPAETVARRTGTRSLREEVEAAVAAQRA